MIMGCPARTETEDTLMLAGGLMEPQRGREGLWVERRS